MNNAKKAILPILLALLAAACNSPSGRIMDEGEDDLVDQSGAGIATFDRLIAGAVGEMLDWYTEAVLEGETPTGKMVAFAGVENKTAEPLAEMREAVKESIATAITDYDGFDVMSERYILAGLRETGLTTEQLFIPSNRNKFLAVLERETNPANALVFATLTRATSRAGRDSQARYTLTLEMVDSETGKQKRFAEDVNKAFSR